MRDQVKDLIKSVFKSYINGEPITPHTEASIKTVQRMLKIDNGEVYCKNTDCVYQKGGKCCLSLINKKECLSINCYGECNSFSDNEEDLDY